MKSQILTRNVLWLLFVLSFAFLFFYDLPHKGFDFTDHGFYLFNGMLLTKGIVSWEGVASIINGFFIKCGISQYLFFERLYYMVSIITVMLFWKSLRPISYSFTLPLVLIITLIYHNTYMISYQTLPVLIAMLGFTAFFSIKETTKDVHRIIYYVVTSFCFSFFAFSNIVLCLTSLTTFALFVIALRREPYRYVFFSTYLIFVALFAFIYFSSPNSLFAIGLGGQLTFGQILHKVPLLFTHVLGEVAGIFRVLAWVLLAWFIVLLLRFRFGPFSGIGFFLHSLNFCKNNRASVLVFLWIIFLLSSKHVWQLFNHLHYDLSATNLLHFNMLQLYLFLIALFTVKKDALYSKILFAFIVLLPAIVAMATSTKGIFDSHIILFTPFFVAATCLLFEQSLNYQERWHTLVKSIFLALFLGFTLLGLYLQGSYSYRSYPIAENKLLIKEGVLRGIYVDKEKYRNINSLIEQYQTNGCQNKYFIAYPSLPLLYYIFKRDALLNQDWITARFGAIGENSAVLIQALQQAGNWCVIEAPKFDNEKADYLTPLHNFLENNSAKVIYYVSPQPQHFELYPYNYTMYVK